MKYCIVGNNDGPLRLWKSLKKANVAMPEYVGLQKKPNQELWNQYQKHVPEPMLFYEFDEETLIKKLSNSNSKLLINCFCNFKFKKLLDQFQCINIHPSYLPFYRGRHPIHWALINGETHHGITIHQMNERYDDGAILWQKKIALNASYSVKQVRELLLNALEEDFPVFLEQFFQGSISLKSNIGNEKYYYRPRVPEDSCIDNWKDIEQLYRKVKALRSEDFPAYVQDTNGRHIMVKDVHIEPAPSMRSLHKLQDLPSVISVSKDEVHILFNHQQMLRLLIEETEENTRNFFQIQF